MMRLVFMLTLDALIARWRGRRASLLLDVDHNRATYQASPTARI
jgi:hypothetical protein